MIKVVQFIHGLNMGGAEMLVKDYVLGLDKEKFEVVVLCYEKYNSPYPAIIEEAGIKIVNISDDMPLYGNRDVLSRLINRISVPILLRRKIRQLRLDVIHEHLPLNRYLKFARPPKGTSIFFTQHFQVSRWIKNYPKDIEAAKWLMKSYPMTLIALNDSMKEEMNSVFSTNNTVVLNNGIDIQRFKELPV